MSKLRSGKVPGEIVYEGGHSVKPSPTLDDEVLLSDVVPSDVAIGEPKRNVVVDDSHAPEKQEGYPTDVYIKMVRNLR
jgi:hypothetical protein